MGGSFICLDPTNNFTYQLSGVNSPDGIPKVWDEDANGYVKGEAVICLFLQYESQAKRIYGTVLNIGVNNDGYKTMGFSFPAAKSQEKLLVEVIKSSNVDPSEVNYFEAHATGTAVSWVRNAQALFLYIIV